MTVKIHLIIDAQLFPETIPAGFYTPDRDIHQLRDFFG
jgi:hypothetical protein